MSERKKPSKKKPGHVTHSHPHHDHGHERAAARCAVVTVSDSRVPENDDSGRIAVELLQGNGHTVLRREIIPDDIEIIWSRAAALCTHGEHDLVLFTGGTGISRRDVTPEAVRPLLDKELPGFGELFRRLSHEAVGPAAFMSRALAGTVQGTLLVALPGSPAAVRLALEKILLAELPHLLFELRKHAAPPTSPHPAHDGHAKAAKAAGRRAG